jgi:exosortase
METLKETINRNSTFWMLGLIFVFILLVYHSTLSWLFQRYTASDTYYSHGYLVPLVSGYLIWLKRKELKGDWKGNLFGLLLIIFSLSLHFLSMLVQVFFVSGFSLLFLITGIALFLFGVGITRKIIFPLSFLIFMFPLPLEAINIICVPMKVLVTKSVVFIFSNILNIPIKNEGFQIFLPNAILSVENSCSGLRSLIVILALGSIFAYLLKASKPKKILLFFLAVPITLISNTLRVFLLGLAVYIYGNKAIEGLLHDFTGYLVFVISFAGLWLFWKGLQCEDLAQDALF